MTDKLESCLRERCETERFFALAQDLLQAADTIAAQATITAMKGSGQ